MLWRVSTDGFAGLVATPHGGIAILLLAAMLVARTVPISCMTPWRVK